MTPQRSLTRANTEMLWHATAKLREPDASHRETGSEALGTQGP